MIKLLRCRVCVFALLIIILLTGCDRPLPTEVSQGLTQAAPTLDVLIGTATTIAGQIAATLAEAQISTDVPLTAEAYVQDLSTTAAALLLPAASNQIEATAYPYPVQSTPVPSSSESAELVTPIPASETLAAVYPAEVQVYPAAAEVTTAVEQPIDASETLEPVVTEIPVETVVPIATEAPAATITPLETIAVVVTIEVTEPSNEMEATVMTTEVAAPGIEPAVTESVYLGIVQQATGSETPEEQVSATQEVIVAVPIVETSSTPESATQAAAAEPELTQESAEATLPTETASAPEAAQLIEEETKVEFEQVIPDVYYLKRGEFPYCLARRFDIHPRKLMNINGFFEGQVFYAGQPVIIPGTYRPFPGERALRFHPETYRVKSSRETIYSIACYYGDIDPLQLAWLNGLQAPYRLSRGMVLTLPEER